MDFTPGRARSLPELSRGQSREKNPKPTAWNWESRRSPPGIAETNRRAAYMFSGRNALGCPLRAALGGGSNFRGPYHLTRQEEAVRLSGPPGPGLQQARQPV